MFKDCTIDLPLQYYQTIVSTIQYQNLCLSFEAYILCWFYIFQLITSSSTSYLVFIFLCCLFFNFKLTIYYIILMISAINAWIFLIDAALMLKWWRMHLFIVVSTSLDFTLSNVTYCYPINERISIPYLLTTSSFYP